MNPKFERTGALSVEYRKAREGPNNFLVWEPNKSYICLTSKDVLDSTKWGKGTQTGLDLRAWLQSIDESDRPFVETEKLNIESWGPEAHDP